MIPGFAVRGVDEAAMERPVAIEARHVGKAFGVGASAVRALDGVSVEIREGEFFTLLGPFALVGTLLLGVPLQP